MAMRRACSGVMSTLVMPETMPLPKRVRMPFDSQMMLVLTVAPDSMVLKG